jgi:hypothetical protein
MLARLRTAHQSLEAASGNLTSFARLTRDLPNYARHQINLAQSEATVRANLAVRAQRFLDVVERAVYGHARSPYRRLLQSVGCQPGDVNTLVAREGVEGALSVLASQGVYVTFDELKGRRQAVRGSQRFHFDETDFDNPLVRPHLVIRTSGSGGRPGRNGYPLEFFREWSAGVGALFGAHGLHDPRHAYWWPVPIHWMLISARLGQPSDGWFYPVHPLPRIAVLGAYYLALVSRLARYPIPTPNRCDLQRPEKILQWLSQRIRVGQPIVFWCAASAAVRLAVAATRANTSLSGVTMMIGGEPVTMSRRALIEESGAGVIVMYNCVEAAGLSYSCAVPTSTDDVHVFTDRFAVVQHERQVTAASPAVDALLVTSLTPTAAKITFNTETGDYGTLVERDCDCRLGALGLRTHLSGLRSFEKLTGEGVTFARSSLEQILETVLPTQFGGSGIDYQLVEEEAPDSSTRIVLRVHPAVGPHDPDAIRGALLNHLQRGSASDKYHASIWDSTGAVEVRRQPPLATRAGKVLPFQARRRSGM